MKPLLLILTLTIGLSTSLFAQAKKLEIVCEVYEGDINYSNLSKFLPDSLKNLLITVKEHSKRDDLDLVNLLCLYGWTLVSPKVEIVTDYRSDTPSKDKFILKREIIVSDEEYQAIINRTKSVIK